MLSGRRTSRRAWAGFSLLELMVVASIVIILTSIAVPAYHQHVKRAREAVLREDLYHMRIAIGAYALDKLHGPQSLDELVSGDYLPEIPLDPFTHSRETWVVTEENEIQSVDQTQPGITEVHSGSTLTASDGTPYSTW